MTIATKRLCLAMATLGMMVTTQGSARAGLVLDTSFDTNGRYGNVYNNDTLAYDLYNSSSNGSDALASAATSVGSSNALTIVSSSDKLAVTTASSSTATRVDPSATVVEEYAVGESTIFQFFHVDADGTYRIEASQGYTFAFTGAPSYYYQYAGFDLVDLTTGVEIYKYEFISTPDSTTGSGAGGTVPALLTLSMTDSYLLFVSSRSISQVLDAVASSTGTANASLSLTAVPEPATVVSASIAGLIALGPAGHRRRTKLD